MHIGVNGESKSIANYKVEVAVRWLADKLLPARTVKQLGIEVIFVPYLRRKEHAYGLCLPADCEKHHREFDIKLDSKLSQRSILEALCHEMVHVKQYARGELKQRVAYSALHTYWKGKDVLTQPELDYWDRPWEIEAHGRERGLFLRLAEHFDDLEI